MDSSSSINSHRKVLPPINDDDFLKIGFETKEDLIEAKHLLSTPVASAFNSNVLRITLNMQEEKIASVLVALYTSKIDEEMILRAIKTSQIEFL